MALVMLEAIALHPGDSLALVRCRNRHDRLVFAVHAYIESQGYTLVGVGADAEREPFTYPVGDSLELEPVALKGWNELDGSYAFRYLGPKGTPDCEHLYMKALPLDGRCMLQWQAGTGPVRALDLSLDETTTGAEGLAAGYRDLAGLTDRLAAAGLCGGGSPDEGAAGQNNAGGRPSTQRSGASRRPGTEIGGPPGIARPDDPYGVIADASTAVGSADVVPPGMRAPGTGHSPLMEGPPRRGGGMLVGPDDPLFDRRFGPGSGDGGHPGWGQAHPSGARWDPISPPGLPGFQPARLGQGGPPGVHPDIMQPGPGRSGTGAEFGFM